MDATYCHLCFERLDTVNPWSFGKFTLGQLDERAQMQCQTCKFRKEALIHYTSDPQAEVVFQQKPERFRLGREFFEIFKVASASSSPPSK